jgi:hypothetical protein
MHNTMMLAWGYFILSIIVIRALAMAGSVL